MSGEEEGDEARVYNHSYLHYGETAYWEERYKLERSVMVKFKCFDWYCPFEELYSIFQSAIPIKSEHQVLIVGVGRSSMVDILYKKGFHNIMAIDVSPTLTFMMQETYKDLTGVSFAVMDVRYLNSIKDSSMSIVLDKACLDAIFCSTHFLDDSRQIFREIFRVLEPNGVFISFSYAPPPSRVPFLRAVNWAVDVWSVPFGESIYMYILTKTNDKTLLAKRVDGAEAAFISKSTMVKDTSAGVRQWLPLSKRDSKGAGFLTVTSSADVIADLVRESEEVDG